MLLFKMTLTLVSIKFDLMWNIYLITEVGSRVQERHLTVFCMIIHQYRTILALMNPWQKCSILSRSKLLYLPNVQLIQGKNRGSWIKQRGRHWGEARNMRIKPEIIMKMILKLYLMMRNLETSESVRLDNLKPLPIIQNIILISNIKLIQEFATLRRLALRILLKKLWLARSYQMIKEPLLQQKNFSSASRANRSPRSVHLSPKLVTIWCFQMMEI